MRRWPCSTKTMATRSSEDDEDDHPEPEPALVGLDLLAVDRHRRDDVGEDQDRHAVADAALGDELGEPHHHGRAGGEHEDDEQHPRSGEVLDEVDVAAGAEELAAVEQEHQARALHDGKRDGEVAGGLGELALADGSLLAPLLELRDHRLEQLDDDRGRDVGHDPEPEDRGSGERAAREQVEEAEHAAGLLRGADGLDLGEVDTGHDDVRAHQVDADDEQGEQDLVAEVRDLEHVPQTCEHQILSSLGASRPRGCRRSLDDAEEP